MKISKGTTARAVKTVVYGVEGIGKSTFASKFPAPMFFDLDNGTARLDVNRATGFDNWEDLLKSVEDFYKADWAAPYRTLIIDTADAAARMCESYVIRIYGKGATSIESFPYGKGYKILAEEFSRLLVDLEVLIDSNINVVIVAHALQRTVTLPEAMGSYDHWELKLPGTSVNKLGPLIKEWADMLIFANYKTTIVEAGMKKKAVGGKRVMYLGHTSFADAKNRFGLEGMFPFDYSVIEKYIPVDLPRADPVQKSMAEVKKQETVMESAEPAPKKPRNKPLKRKKAITKDLLAKVNEAMAKGLANDPAPITDEELTDFLSSAFGKPVKITEIDAESAESLLANWDKVQFFVQNNVRVPF